MGRHDSRKRLMNVYKISLFIAIVCCVEFMPQPSRADVESLLAEINAKPAEERLKTLVDGARKEGVLYYNGATNLSDVQEITRASARTTRSLICVLPDWED